MFPHKIDLLNAPIGEIEFNVSLQIIAQFFDLAFRPSGLFRACLDSIFNPLNNRFSLRLDAIQLDDQQQLNGSLQGGSGNNALLLCYSHHFLDVIAAHGRVIEEYEGNPAV